MAELERIATENKLEDLKSESSGGALAKSRFLVFDSVIKGGMQEEEGLTGAFRRIMIGPDQEIQFLTPVAVGGVDNYLYVVDSGLRIVFRYDFINNTIEPIGNVGAQFAGEMGRIYVARDRSFYVVDPTGRQVLHFDEQGMVTQTFQDLANLSRPIDIIYDETTNDLLVADGSYSHIVVFNQAGRAVRTIGQRGTGPGRFRAMTAMTMGDDGLYVLDRLELPVQVLTINGDYKYSFGESHHTFPSAIAVNDDGVVYVADKSDNTIRIYQDAELLSVFGGTGSAPGRFREITSMWINNDLLYVADSMNRRVQVLRMTSEEPAPAVLTQ
ncbi:MAG: 6-bladed beta-propeller [Gammaproteobacteria bacterium]|nr:6-bladed beta-propeller [Gammaproteobacteria bacterium]